MASEAKGYLRVPVWVNDGVVKPLVNDDGRVPVLLDFSSVTLDVNLKTSDITLGVTESNPLTQLDVNLKTSDITLGVTESNPLTQLDVNLKTSDITLGVTESTPLTSIQSQLYGWDLTYWRKNPIVWGYTTQYIDSGFKNDVAAGTQSIDLLAVDTGYVRVITAIAAYCTTTNPTFVTFQHRHSGGGYYIESHSITVPNFNYATKGFFVLTVDDFIRVEFSGCILNDDIRATAFGYELKVNE